MENAVEALKMAGAVLVFVMAISVIIFFFTRTRQATDTIVNYRDRESAYVNTGYYGGQIGTRRVSLDTIIPTIYRAYVERYTIVFVGLDSPIYRIENRTGQTVNKYVIELEQQPTLTYPNPAVGSTDAMHAFISGILYHDYSGMKKIRNAGIVMDSNGNYTNYTGTQDDFENYFKIKVDSTPLYNQLDGKTIYEDIGIYYQGDSVSEPDVNKTEKRIITYTVK